MQRLAAVLLAVSAAVTLTTCRGAETTGPVVPSSVASLSGNFQTGVAGHILPQPLSVLATASSGAGVPNVPVQWTVTAGGGSLSATTVATDSLGRSSVTLTLGPTAGVLDVALNAAFGWWWADPAAALVMLPLIVREGVEAL
jgi:divalent metal cation (Fe/Co/Zn/Cd) transporter